ncbi:hypothetical protein HGRIS_000677 [Hohenbuehelia grisea]|uniref:Phosducin domain-containing protein n=1 Tax=Hohenbuehelia grisea TaxID=104357 RepID=A0ABR3JSN6_9AGAR
MMNADLEALVLSGELFNQSGRDPGATPPRTPSPDHGWHDELLNGDGDEEKPLGGSKSGLEPSHESIGMGPGRTGVKGVIRDHDEANSIGRQQAQHAAHEKAAAWERGNLGGATYLEEERAKARHNQLFGLDEKIDRLVLDEHSRDKAWEKAAIGDAFGFGKKRRFGHLREVGVKGFVNAVEKEDRGVYVVVHLYDPSLERCYVLDETLAQLARAHAGTKFLRSRAAALGFASSSGPTSKGLSIGSSSSAPDSRSKTRSICTSRIAEDSDEEDPYADGGNDEDEDADDSDLEPEEDDVDLDMLPTMLVYRDGELVHTWVRVDWEAGSAGIEDLLERHHVFGGHSGPLDNLGLPSDGEDDTEGLDDNIFWSDNED